MSWLKKKKTVFAQRTEGFKRGGRKGAKKVMLVITDGESHDSPDLQKAMEDTEADNITMYAIAVSQSVPFYTPLGTL